MKNFIFILVLFTAIQTYAVFDQIHILGNKKITDATILYYANISKNDVYNDAYANEVLKKIYAIGYFDNVNIEYKNNILTITVVERPVINKIQFIGNKTIKDKDFPLTLKTGDIFATFKLKNDIQAILDTYKKRGYFNVFINPKIINNNDTVILIYEIKENFKATINKIQFINNHVFNDSVLKENILSRQKVFYKIFNPSDVFDPARLDYDVELLKEFYFNRGYPKFKVVDIISEMNKDNKSFNVSFILDEGQAYNMGKISLNNKITSISDNDIMNLFTIKTGDKFNLAAIQNVENNINRFLASKGYAFAVINHVISYNGDNADIIFNIEETNKFFINQINILNNVRTKDTVIRRQLKVVEGDGYDINKINRSLQLLKNLDYFSNVEITPKLNQDKIDLDVNIEEKSTGNLWFNYGYNTVTGPFTGVTMSERNIIGTGNGINFTGQYGQLDKMVTLNLTRPYFLDLDLLAGIELFYNDQTYDQDVIDYYNTINKQFEEDNSNSYHTTKQGGKIFGNYAISEYLQHEVRYILKSERISDFTPNISVYLKANSGLNIVSAVGHSLIYDKRDNSVRPTDGYLMSIDQDLAGLGGDSKFIKNQILGIHYWPLLQNKLVIKLLGKGGIITSYDNRKIRIIDNFFLGEKTIRGFNIDGIGDRDAISLDSLGGQKYLLGTLQLDFPLGLPKDIDVKGSIFTDAETLFKIDVPNGINTTLNPYFNSSKIRSSYGIGITWGSPLGVINASYTIPIAKEQFDITKKFRISFGTSF